MHSFLSYGKSQLWHFARDVLSNEIQLLPSIDIYCEGSLWKCISSLYFFLEDCKISRVRKGHWKNVSPSQQWKAGIWNRKKISGVVWRWGKGMCRFYFRGKFSNKKGNIHTYRGDLSLNDFSKNQSEVCSCVFLISSYLDELVNVQLFNISPTSPDMQILQAFGQEPIPNHLWKECTDLN